MELIQNKRLRSYLCLLFIFFSFSANAQTITICSWNIQNLGQSKNDEEIAFIANTVKSFDVVVIQEVVAGLSGPPAVMRLNDQLNRLGSKWEYSISHGTSGSKGSKERYAFLWGGRDEMKRLELGGIRVNQCLPLKSTRFSVPRGALYDEIERLELNQRVFVTSV